MDEHSESAEMKDRRDMLISRVIDGEAGESDWHALRTLAEADPAVWGELTETQRQHEALSGLVDEVGALAEHVEIPEGELMTPTERFERRMASVRAWGGWAAAAAVLLVWFTGLPAPTGRGPAGPTAGLGPSSEIADMGFDGALARYLDEGKRSGRVLGQVPERVVLETRPAGEGLEVVYLRQIVERELVSPERLYRLGRDEFGKAALLPEETPRATRVSY
jgi:hypothetical protein